MLRGANHDRWQRLSLWLVATAVCLSLPACGSTRDESGDPAFADRDPPPPALPASPVPLAPARLWLFDKSPADEPPEEMSDYGGRWVVDRSNPSPRFAQSLCHYPMASTETSEAATAGSPATAGRSAYGAVAVATGAYYANVDISAYVKIVAGASNSSAGLALRVRSGDHFYLAQASAASGEVALIRVEPGKSTNLGSRSGVITADRWHLLRVRAFDGVIEVSLDDKVAIEVRDDEIRWGMIGLWSSVDGVSCFDELAAAPR